jgi:hypothetical protein
MYWLVGFTALNRLFLCVCVSKFPRSKIISLDFIPNVCQCAVLQLILTGVFLWFSYWLYSRIALLVKSWEQIIIHMKT